MEPQRIAVIVPALDEEEALPRVLSDLRALGLISSTIVVDNGSRDGTARVAAAAGARVASEPNRGYGAACLRGIAEAARLAPPPSILVFLDADHSDDPLRIHDLVRPIEEEGRDLVIGARSISTGEGPLLPAHQRAGNALACALIRLLFGRGYSDLGPFRAIRREALDRLRMRDRTFGWTVEMQVKAIRAGLSIAEVEVPTRPRIGRSKISGTISGSVKAGCKIIWKILALRLWPPRGGDDRGGPAVAVGRTSRARRRRRGPMESPGRAPGAPLAPPAARARSGA